MSTINLSGNHVIEGVPTNPRALAADERFPDMALYRTLLDHLGKVDADRLWGDAHAAAGKRVAA